MRRTKKISLHEQLAYMRLHWPQFETRITGGTLTSVGDLQPSELCATYRISISYPAASTPVVRVLEPQLKPREDGGEIPHMYEQDRLCLYLPGTEQWTPAKPIAVTIVPWTSLWLFFYEIWRATGTWHGGGIEPETKSPIRRETEPYDRTKKAK